METLTVAAARSALTALRVRNAPMRDRGVAILRLEQAIREQGPEVTPLMVLRGKPEVCCAAATVDYSCTCGHVTRCVEHGEKHHGSHS